MKRYARRKYSDAETRVIGRHVRRLRILQGMTQVDLALNAHVSVAMISKLETGRYPYRIAMRAVQSLAQALNTSVGYLIGESSNDQSLSDMAVLSGLMKTIKDGYEKQ